MKNNRTVLLAGLALVLAILAAYHNSFGGPFIFDDQASILYNPSIRQLWPLSTALNPPHGVEFTVNSRPLLNLSLAINYAISGREVWSYHAFNVLVHALAGLTLFGLTRRTLLRPVIPARLRELALPTAWVVALGWALHPLQTESVTYVIQRAESLMGLFYLLTLYCFVRAMDSPRPAGWLAGSVAACLLGTGCKEVIVTAPVVVLLYDRALVAGGFAEAWRLRRGYYVALFATWLPLAWLVASMGGNRGGAFIFTWSAFWQHVPSQFIAIEHYVRLALWPEPLVFDYGSFTVEHLAEVAWPAFLVTVLLVATGWALWKRPVAGFLGATFFLILSPTSLLPATQQLIVEHRMYLPLAVITTLWVGAMGRWLGRPGLAIGLVLALVAGGLTVRRNFDYRSEISFWQDNAAKQPNARVLCSLATAYYAQGALPEAERLFRESIAQNPNITETHYNLGLVLDRLQRHAEAIESYQRAVQCQPSFAAAHAELGRTCYLLGRLAEAESHLRHALALGADPGETNHMLALVLAGQGRAAEALDGFAQALLYNPNLAAAHLNYGLLLATVGRPAEARVELTRALALDPKLPMAREALEKLTATGAKP